MQHASSSSSKLLAAIDGPDDAPADLSHALSLVSSFAGGSGSATAYNASNWQLSLDTDPFSPLLSKSSPSETPQRQKKGRNALEWLQSALPEPARFDQALTILESPSSDADIASSLLEVFGFEEIENVSEAVSKRQDIVAQAQAPSSPSLSPTDALRAARLSPEILRSVSDNRRSIVPRAQVQFSSAEELAEAKRARKASRYKGKAKEDDIPLDVDLEEWQRIHEESLKSGPMPIIPGSSSMALDAEKYPNIYLAPGRAAASLLMAGHKLALPFGTTKIDRGEYEEITIPAPKPVPFRFDEKLFNISDMDEWGQRTFKAYKTLNRLQSIVYPIAYGSNENMLVCAPTGAGKTDVAALTVLRCLSQLAKIPLTRGAHAALPPASKYKIVYVAPLKALAAEITQKFAKRLGWAGVRVRELTGDMRLSKREIDETAIIVTTPEKWDVVTRKTGSSDSEVADKVRLLIIDEVHLLHDDRGSVIESIVARTLRQIESSQTMIRIVGLSATLPNYVDVADFLVVNRYRGLFYFDSSFRPVPLEQHFIGAKGKAGTVQNRNNIDGACFDKVAELVKAGHQVMVFVHSRKDTVKTADMLRTRFQADDLMDYLTGEDHGKYASFKRDLTASRNREMRELANYGFGIHHAGMLRSDRNLSERMFEEDVTKVLCCTATLAWGVNLPAYAVVIKGTSVYDSGRGSAVDLSILDVLQIFGRAGRPQFESQGVGYICTSHDKLDHYVSAMTQQHPIESKFITGLVDSLNAEISLGTVANMDEGVRWLGYSYLYVRMRKNPLMYGMVAEDVMQDPLLGKKRHELILSAAKRLAEVDMIRLDQDTGRLESTPLGRVAAKYYIRSASIEIFNRRFRARMTEADVLALIASSVEFNQVQVRENELPELRALLERIPCQIENGITDNTGKVNCLLQAYISRLFVEDFALVSDTAYVAQNATRIARALLEISLARKWATTSLVLLSITKSIERRLWSFSHPLNQFDLPGDVLLHVDENAGDIPLAEIGAMSDSDFGKLIKLNERLGGMATRAAREMPALEISHTVKSLSNDLLKITLRLRRAFDWSDKLHGSIEPFWVWIEDEKGHSILDMTRAVVRSSTHVITHDFYVPATQATTAMAARALPDRWISEDESHEIDLNNIVLPDAPAPTTQLLLLPLLKPVDAFSDALLQGVYGKEITVFDSVQTQSLHAVYHTANNVFLAAPDASSRSLMLELAIWRQINQAGDARVLVLCPSKQLARSMHLRLKRVFAPTRAAISLCSKEADLVDLPSNGSLIAITAPGPAQSLALADSPIVASLNLLIALDIHAMSLAYEHAISRMATSVGSRRIVASGASLLDSRGVADWLDVPAHAFYNFAPSSRSSSLVTNVVPFSLPHSVALLRTMAKPAFASIKTASGGTICFVPSRAQCNTTAMDLVALTGGGLEESLLTVPDDEMEKYAAMLNDSDRVEALLHGIAVCHEGLPADEQRLALHLFNSGIARVLVVPRESCYTLPVRASLVICLGAQYTTHGEDDQREIRNYPLDDLLQMQRYASPADSESTAEFMIMCQPGQADLYKRFLLQGYPLESAMDSSQSIAKIMLDDLADGRVRTRQDIVDFLALTYAGQRVRVNPSYYGIDDPLGGHDARAVGDRRVSRFADKVVDEYEQRCLVMLPAKGSPNFSRTKILDACVEHELDLDDVRSLQSLSLDDMVRFSGAFWKVAPAPSATESSGNDSSTALAPAKKDGEVPKSETAATTTKPAAKTAKDKLRSTPLQAFFKRLPKPIRDSVGAQTVEGGEERKDVWQARVLLAAFGIGRIPRDSVELEDAQVELVKALISGRGL